MYLQIRDQLWRRTRGKSSSRIYIKKRMKPSILLIFIRYDSSCKVKVYSRAKGQKGKKSKELSHLAKRKARRTGKKQRKGRMRDKGGKKNVISYAKRK